MRKMYLMMCLRLIFHSIKPKTSGIFEVLTLRYFDYVGLSIVITLMVEPYEL